MGGDWRTKTLLEGARVGFDLCEGGMCREALNVLPRPKSYVRDQAVRSEEAMAKLALAVTSSIKR
jgi:hypothetical protein